jgi:hypothetical protein
MSVSALVIICCLKDHYLPSTFIQLGHVYPQLQAIVFYLRTIFLRLFDRGLSQKMPGKQTEVLFTKEELKKYSETSSGLYLAILGKVYDVGKGEKFYGPGGSYHFFTGM